MFRFFANVQTIEALKKQYRQLALKHHPDIGGNEETMKAINAEYVIAFAHVEKIERQAGNKKEFNVNDGYRQVIDAIIHLDALKVEICGSWVWVTGETRKYKDALKSAGYYWAPKKEAWYWRPAEARNHFSKGRYSLDEIREKYGSEQIEAKKQGKIA